MKNQKGKVLTYEDKKNYLRSQGYNLDGKSFDYINKLIRKQSFLRVSMGQCAHVPDRRYGKGGLS